MDSGCAQIHNAANARQDRTPRLGRCPASTAFLTARTHNRRLGLPPRPCARPPGGLLHALLGLHLPSIAMMRSPWTAPTARRARGVRGAGGGRAKASGERGGTEPRGRAAGPWGAGAGRRGGVAAPEPAAQEAEPSPDAHRRHVTPPRPLGGPLGPAPLRNRSLTHNRSFTHSHLPPQAPSPKYHNPAHLPDPTPPTLRRPRLRPWPWLAPSPWLGSQARIPNRCRSQPHPCRQPPSSLARREPRKAVRTTDSSRLWTRAQFPPRLSLFSFVLSEHSPPVFAFK
ncbi:hypothetical protein ACRRTK_005229 [Alexandromys fortis]